MFRRPTNSTERLALRQAFIPKGARPILEHTNGSACYAYESANGVLYAIGFRGTAARPDFHYRYRSEADRNAAIWQFRESVERSASFRAERNAAKSAAANTLKVGDILYTSWGYDQTNVDFFVVTRTVGKTRVFVRPIAADYEATGFMSGNTWPAMPIRMTGPETMHVSRGDAISINGHHASRETGRTHGCSSYA